MAEKEMMKEGPTAHVSGDHMRAMSLEPMAHGTPVHMEGHVVGGGTHEDEHGKPVHHMEVRIHHMEMKKGGKKSTGEKLYGGGPKSEESGEAET